MTIAMDLIKHLCGPGNQMVPEEMIHPFLMVEQRNTNLIDDYMRYLILVALQVCF